MDWVGHHVDIAHWGLGFDNAGPSEVSGQGEFPARTALWNTATRYKVVCKYPQDVTMTIAGGHDGIRSGTRWIGANGWIWVNRGAFEASNPDWLRPEFRAGSVELPTSPGGHYAQFISAVKWRQKTLTPAEVALHSATPGWLGNIAMFTGRTIKWDAENMRIVGDAEATRLLSRHMRAPFQLG